MTEAIDLREESAEDRRELLFDALDDLGTDETITVLADRDVDPLLIRYQIEREYELEWNREDPDAAAHRPEDAEAEARRLRVTRGTPLEEGELGAFDVRELPPQRRHGVLLETFDDLAPDEGFVLVNDHDPKPLYHELRSIHGDVLEWEYASRDAGEWRVEIVKTAASEAGDADVYAKFDVREIPKRERHPTIHHRYGTVPDGETMELVAPHEPRPLHREFRERYGDAFSWEVVENEPGRCRVHVTKGERADDEDGRVDDDGKNGRADEEPEPSSDDLAITAELDVRDLPPARRHAKIFDSYAELDAGDGFVLVNDHDPKPLYHQFEAEAGPEFRWEYRQRDPGEFRVLIGKADVEGADSVANEEPTPSEEPEAPF